MAIYSEDEDPNVQQWEKENIMSLRDFKANYIKDIALIINQQGTLVQEEGFKQVPVHHMTTREFSVDGDVVLYIGAEYLFCESGGEYPLNELSIDEVKEIFDFFN